MEESAKNQQAEIYQYVGKSTPIHNGAAKATGRQCYVADRRLPNLHYAQLVYSTIAHGLVEAVDTTVAQQVPGVVKIFTCFNTTDRLYCRSRAMASEEAVCQEALFPKEVRFVGDRVAMVVAKTKAAAQQAASFIKVTYQPLPAVLAVAAAQQPQAPQLHPQGNVYPCGPLVYGEKPESPKLQTLETGIHLPRLHHASMETHGCVAAYQTGPDKLTIWSPCQSVFAIRTGVADLLELPYHQVQVIQETMGGSFGCKQETILEPLAALAAKSIKAPVQLVLSREECMNSTILRAPVEFQVKSFFLPSGKILGLEVDCTLEAGAYLTNSQDYLYAMSEKLTRVYRFDYVCFTGRAVCTNTPVSGSYRSWGSAEIATAVEQAIEAIAQKLELDPVALRLQNVQQPGGEHGMAGITVGNCHLEKCLELGQERFDWQQEKQAVVRWNKSHSRYRQGLGVALGGHINGFYPNGQEHATVGLRMNEDGTVNANLCLHDHGCGTITAFRKLIAEVLDIAEIAILIENPNTDYNYYDFGCYGSRTTYVVGRAVQNCAVKLLKQIEAQAAVFLAADVDQLSVEKGRVYLTAQPEKGLSYWEIAQLAQTQTQQDLYAVENYVAASNPTSAGVHLVKLQVDCYTGLVKVLKYLAVHDLGRAVNPAMCQAQLGGAVQQGVGAALSEEFLLNPENGAPWYPNYNLHKYHLVNAPDLPLIDVAFVEEGGDQGPFGAKSIGEVALVSVAAATLNALSNCLPGRVTELPLTPARLLALLERAAKEAEAE